MNRPEQRRRQEQSRRDKARAGRKQPAPQKPASRSKKGKDKLSKPSKPAVSVSIGRMQQAKKNKQLGSETLEDLVREQSTSNLPKGLRPAIVALGGNSTGKTLNLSEYNAGKGGK